MEYSIKNKNKFSYYANHKQNKLLDDYLEDKIEDFKELVQQEYEDEYNYYQTNSLTTFLERNLANNYHYYSNHEIINKAKSTVASDFLKPSFFDKADPFRNPIDSNGLNLRLFFKYEDISDEGLSFIPSDLLCVSDITQVDHVYFLAYLEYSNSDFTKLTSLKFYLMAENTLRSEYQRYYVARETVDDFKRMIVLCSREYPPSYSLYTSCIQFVYCHDPFVNKHKLPMKRLVEDYSNQKLYLDDYQLLNEIEII